MNEQLIIPGSPRPPVAIVLNTCRIMFIRAKQCRVSERLGPVLVRHSYANGLGASVAYRRFNFATGVPEKLWRLRFHFIRLNILRSFFQGRGIKEKGQHAES